jgi:hypothetical protein
MNTLKINNWSNLPKNYTGIAEYHNGDKYWFLNGKKHRNDGPAIEYYDGSKAWYLNGKLHRNDGPASEIYTGDKIWYLNDKIHRVDGPAVEYADGNKFWCLKGVEYSQEEWFERLSGEDKLKAIWNLR